MYISCKVTSGTPLESESGYVPNNPLFGITLDSPQECLDSCVGCISCQDVPSIPPIHTDDLDCESCFDQNLTVLSSSGGNSNPQINLSNFWNTDDMNSSFPGLPPLDIDPLPSLFPFSPCGASYKYEKPPGTQDVADVLLSLKHAVIKPNTSTTTTSETLLQTHYQGQNNLSFSAPQTSLSYTVHPQMLLSPNSHHFNQSQSSNNQNNHHLNSSQSSSYYDTVVPVPNHQFNGQTTTNQTPLYPSMSVNVSMNMTMHGYPPAENTVPLQCSQWPSNTQSSVNVLYPQLLSPTHYPGGATYSFTADFRPPATTSANNNNNNNNNINNINNNHNSQTPNNINQYVVEQQNKMSPILQSQQQQRSSFHHQHSAMEQQLSPKSPIYLPEPKDQLRIDGFDEDEESNDGSESNNKPNLCRLCGKSYARPSTLKTHLRTHSGERPYRCNQCNKSFSQAANLTAHVRTHTGQKPFRCLICDRRFSQSSSVTTHMRTHSGERPYRCRSCKKAFSDSSTLTKHLRIHSGEKPYQCKLCYLRFSQSGNLNRHMRVHGTNVNNLLS